MIVPLLFALAAGPAPAASPFGVRRPGLELTTLRYEHGVPSDAVIAFAQAPDGYLWIGTNAGLARFDGVRFTVFNHRTTPELPSDQCGPFYLDPKGALWIGTM